TLVVVSSLTEMLPYESRYLSVYIWKFGREITSSIAVRNSAIVPFSFFLKLKCYEYENLHHKKISSVIRDSICHLNIRNNVDVIEKVFCKEEDRLHDEKREGTRHFHRSVAKKIFENLVYLDQDELKIDEFFKRLWRSFTMIEVVLAVFQS
ncbi:hypothetical protein PMAYCL1PPCAC_05951, partial [Pristionchus mayeri]